MKMTFTEALMTIGFEPALIYTAGIICMLLIASRKYREQGYGLLVILAIPYIAAETLQNRNLGTLTPYIVHFGLVIAIVFLAFKVGLDIFIGDEKSNKLIFVKIPIFIKSICQKNRGKTGQ